MSLNKSKVRRVVRPKSTLTFDYPNYPIDWSLGRKRGDVCDFYKGKWYSLAESGAQAPIEEEKSISVFPLLKGNNIFKGP
jgi:hypothetical protein